MTPAIPTSSPQLPQRLAEAILPRRVRVILNHVMDVASDELEQLLQAMLDEQEQHLFRLADHARNPGVESEYLHTLRTLRLNRSDLVPRFMFGLEASLASLGQSLPSLQAAQTGRTGIGRDLSLIDQSEMDETLVLRDIAARHSSRASLDLHLLGQRFGVLAATPAPDIERLPCGPHALCAILREAVDALQLPLDARLLLYRTFDRQVMAQYPQLVEKINATMAVDRLLPSLRYVPLRHHRPELPVWLDGVLGKALHPTPEKRQEAVSEFIHDLKSPGPQFQRTTTPPLIERDPVRFWKCVSALSSLLAIILLLLRAFGR